MNYEEREKRVEGDLDTWSKAVFQFIVLANSGAAVATLSFIGASGQAPWPAVLALAFFTMGVVLAGFTLFGQWDRAYKAWHAVHFPGANPTKRSWLTRSVSWVEPHTGSLVGCSLLAFVVGAIVGLFSLMLHA